jgi:hypothetical protein
MDGKTILERVKHGNIPPTWQIYTEPHILTSTFGAAIILAFFRGIIVAVVVILEKHCNIFTMPILQRINSHLL